MKNIFKILLLILLTFYPLSLTSAFAISDGEGNDLLDLETGGEMRVRDNSDASLLIVEESTGDVGIGVQPDTRLHVDSNAANTTAILELENTSGDFQVFRTDATPESSVTGSAGDLAIDATGGDLYVKRDDGDNSTWIQISGVLDKDFSSTTVANTTTETAIYSYSVPAGIMGANGILRLTLSGTYVNNQADQNMRIRVNFGSTELFNDIIGNGMDADADDAPVYMNLVLANLGSVSSQLLTGTMAMGDQNSGVSGVGDISNDEIEMWSPVRGSSSENTDSGSRTLEITVEHETADAGVSITRDFGLLELL